MTIYVVLIGTCTRLSTLAPIQPSACFTLRPQIMSLPGKQRSPSHKSHHPFPTAALKEAPWVSTWFSGWVSQTEVMRPVHLLHLVRDNHTHKQPPLKNTVEKYHLLRRHCCYFLCFPVVSWLLHFNKTFGLACGGRGNSPEAASGDGITLSVVSCRKEEEGNQFSFPLQNQVPRTEIIK